MITLTSLRALLGAGRGPLGKYPAAAIAARFTLVVALCCLPSAAADAQTERPGPPAPPGPPLPPGQPELADQTDPTTGTVRVPSSWSYSLGVHEAYESDVRFNGDSGNGDWRYRPRREPRPSVEATSWRHSPERKRQSGLLSSESRPGPFHVRLQRGPVVRTDAAIGVACRRFAEQIVLRGLQDPHNRRTVLSKSADTDQCRIHRPGLSTLAQKHDRCVGVPHDRAIPGFGLLQWIESHGPGKRRKTSKPVTVARDLHREYVFHRNHGRRSGAAWDMADDSWTQPHAGRNSRNTAIHAFRGARPSLRPRWIVRYCNDSQPESDFCGFLRARCRTGLWLQPDSPGTQVQYQL